MTTKRPSCAVEPHCSLCFLSCTTIVRIDKTWIITLVKRGSSYKMPRTRVDGRKANLKAAVQAHTATASILRNASVSWTSKNKTLQQRILDTCSNGPTHLTHFTGRFFKKDHPFEATDYRAWRMQYHIHQRYFFFFFWNTTQYAMVFKVSNQNLQIFWNHLTQVDTHATVAP